MAPPPPPRPLPHAGVDDGGGKRLSPPALAGAPVGGLPRPRSLAVGLATVARAVGLELALSLVLACLYTARVVLPGRGDVMVLVAGPGAIVRALGPGSALARGDWGYLAWAGVQLASLAAATARIVAAGGGADVVVQRCLELP